MTQYLIKLQDEKFYLTQGPAGYAFGRSKKKAVKFTSDAEASAMMARISGDVEVVTL